MKRAYRDMGPRGPYATHKMIRRAGVRGREGSISKETRMDNKDWTFWNQHVFRTRGVSREVAEARGYLPYAKGELWVSDDTGPFAAIPRAQRRATITQDVNRVEGLVMMKHAVPGTAPVLPQLRPLRVVETETHAHAGYAPSVRALHVDGHRHGGDGTPGSGVDPGNVPHDHPVGKYKIAVSPVVEQRYFQGHPLRECHHTGPPCHTLEDHTMRHVREKPHDEWNQGLEAAPHVHVRKVRDRDVDGYGKRIDVHPWAMGMLKVAGDTDRAFFVLEGVLKADALLTAGEAVFDVPSVTLWRAPELEKFAKRWLRDVTVFVVTDSDIDSNPDVSLQAFVCVETLRELRITAYVAVPTAEPRACRRHGAPRGSKRGVDDYLADGGRVDDLQVIERERSSGLREWIEFMRGHARRSDRHQTDSTVIAWMSLLADDQGRVRKRLKAVASVTGYSRRTVYDVIERMSEFGPDDYESPFSDVALPVLRRRGYLRDGAWIESTPRDLDYSDVPMFTIRPELRHVERRRTVAEVLKVQVRGEPAP